MGWIDPFDPNLLRAAPALQSVTAAPQTRTADRVQDHDPIRRRRELLLWNRVGPPSSPSAWFQLITTTNSRDD